MEAWCGGTYPRWWDMQDKGDGRVTEGLSVSMIQALRRGTEEFKALQLQETTLLTVNFAI